MSDSSGVQRAYFYIGLFCLFVFVFISLYLGGTILVVIVEIASILFVVFFVYGVLVTGIQSRVESEESIGIIKYERYDRPKMLSERLKRLRDRIFYKY